jgi:hypothetical protein
MQHNPNLGSITALLAPVLTIAQKLMHCNPRQRSTLKSVIAKGRAMIYLEDKLLLVLVMKLLPQLESLDMTARMGYTSTGASQLLEGLRKGAPKIKRLRIEFQGVNSAGIELPLQILTALKDGAAPQLEHLDCDFGHNGMLQGINPALLNAMVDTIKLLSSTGKLQTAGIAPTSSSSKDQIEELVGARMGLAEDFEAHFAACFGIPVPGVSFYPDSLFKIGTRSAFRDEKQLTNIFRLCYPDISSLKSRGAQEQLAYNIFRDFSTTSCNRQWLAEKLFSLVEYCRFPSESVNWHADPSADPFITAAVSLGRFEDEPDRVMELIQRLVERDSRHLLTLSLHCFYDIAMLQTVIPRTLAKLGKASNTTLSAHQVEIACENFWTNTIETRAEGQDKLDAIDLTARALVKFFPAVPLRVRKFSRGEDDSYDKECNDLDGIRKTIRKVLIDTRGR